MKKDWTPVLIVLFAIAMSVPFLVKSIHDSRSVEIKTLTFVVNSEGKEYEISFSGVIGVKSVKLSNGDSVTMWFVDKENAWAVIGHKGAEFIKDE